MSVRLQVVHEEHDDALHLPWLVRLQIDGGTTEGAGVSWLAAALDALNVAGEQERVGRGESRQMTRYLVLMARERTRTQNEREANRCDAG